MARRFLTPLRIEQNLVYPDAGRYVLCNDLVYCTNICNPTLGTPGIFSMRTITVPSQFISDGMTVPAIAWYLNRRGFACGVVHDYLYTSAYVDRKTADLILAEALKDAGFSSIEISIIYNSVRIFGASHYGN